LLAGDLRRVRLRARPARAGQLLPARPDGRDPEQRLDHVGARAAVRSVHRAPCARSRHDDADAARPEGDDAHHGPDRRRGVGDRARDPRAHHAPDRVDAALEDGALHRRPSSVTIAFSSQLIRLMTIAPKRAAQKPLIVKPGTSQATSARQIALTTKMNRPSVTIVNGNVRTMSRGRMIAFTNPSSNPASNAAPNPEMAMPGTRFAARNTAAALTRSRMRNRMVTG